MKNRNPRFLLFDVGQGFQHDACAFNDTGQGVFSHVYRNTQFIHHELIDAVQEGSASGQHDTPGNDIRGEFRGSLFKHGTASPNDVHQGFMHRLFGFIRGDGDGVG